MNDTDKPNNGFDKNGDSENPEEITMHSAHGMTGPDVPAVGNTEPMQNLIEPIRDSSTEPPGTGEQVQDQVQHEPDPDQPMLGKSQPLPNPEEPPGYPWQIPEDVNPLTDTKPIQVPASPLEDQPTVNAGPAAIGEVAVAINLDDRMAPPPGLTDELPRKVDEVDLAATRVTPSAVHVTRKDPASGGSFQPSRMAGTPSNGNPVTNVTPGGKAARNTGKASTTDARGGKKPPANGSVNPRYDFGGCFVKVVVLLLFLAVLGVVIAGVFLVFQYFTIASTLPSVDDIQGHASQFETTRFYDRNGEMIY